MYGAAKLILRDQGRAEDAVQEALLLAWRHVAAVRDPDAWDAWLYRLTVRACYRLARAGGHGQVVELDVRADRVSPAPDFTRTIAERDRLMAALAGAAAGSTGRHRPPLLPRPAPHPGGRGPRRPRRDGEVAPPPRPRGAADVPRRRPGPGRVGDAGATDVSERGDLTFERTLVDAMVDDVGQPPAGRPRADPRRDGRDPSAAGADRHGHRAADGAAGARGRRGPPQPAPAGRGGDPARDCRARRRRAPPAAAAVDRRVDGVGRRARRAPLRPSKARPGDHRCVGSSMPPLRSTRRPSSSASLVLVTSRDGTLHALDLGTGNRRWTASPGTGSGGPAIHGGLVFVVDAGGSVHAYRLADGSPAWTAVTLGTPRVDVAVGGGVVFQATRDGGIVALDARDGADIGTATCPPPGRPRPVSRSRTTSSSREPTRARRAATSLGRAGLVGIDRRRPARHAGRRRWPRVGRPRGRREDRRPAGVSRGRRVARLGCRRAVVRALRRGWRRRVDERRRNRVGPRRGDRRGALAILTGRPVPPSGDRRRRGGGAFQRPSARSMASTSPTGRCAGSCRSTRFRAAASRSRRGSSWWAPQGARSRRSRPATPVRRQPSLPGARTPSRHRLSRPLLPPRRVHPIHRSPRSR